MFRHSRTCDRLTPVYYAAVSGDFNPVHLDPEVARQAGFPSNILHGMCTFAWLAEACAIELGDAGRIRRMRARFSRPVFPGDTITFEGRLLREPLEVTARNQRGEEVLSAVRVETGAQSRAPANDAGKVYGPYRYEVCVERLREFALAIRGDVPARSFGATADDVPAPMVAPPTFAAAFALQPCAVALRDPATGIDLLRVLHGEEDILLHTPVRAGDVLETVGEIVARERKKTFELLTLRTRTTNQRGEAVVDATSSWIAR